MPPSPPHHHDRAAIVAIGDELTLGQSLDTNSRLLADRLVSLGITPVEHVTLPDDEARITKTLRRLVELVPLVIVTGGLGPTDDDLTREALAAAMGEPLVEDEQVLATLRERLARRGRALTDALRRQAQRPRSAVCLPNDVGTAPGLHARLAGGGTDVFCLPGPPGELLPIFERDVLPLLRPDPDGGIVTWFIHTIGLAESDAAARLGALMDRSRDPLVGITASGTVLTVRIRSARAGGAGVAGTADRVRAALDPYVFAEGDATAEGELIDRLGAARQSLVVVESCTGGLLGEMLTRVPGSSDVFLGGWITYSNRMKHEQVGVHTDLLDQFGAVSEPVAVAMARGGMDRSGADHALAITGIAGPGGGSAEKPVGTVWIARASRIGRADARRFVIPGGREDVRLRSARLAVAMLLMGLGGHPVGEPPLLWQVREGGSEPAASA